MRLQSTLFTLLEFWLLLAGYSPCGSPAHPLSCCQPMTGCSSLGSFFALRRLSPHAGLLLPGDALSTWLGFDTPTPGSHSVDTLFILFIWAVAHPYREPLHTLQAWGFSMPGRLFQGIPSLPVWAKPPLWATLLPGWPSRPPEVRGSQRPFLGLPSDLRSGLRARLPSPTWSLCSGSDISCRATFPCCVCILFGFLIVIFKYFISYTLQILHSSFISNFVSLASVHFVY